MKVTKHIRAFRLKYGSCSRWTWVQEAGIMVECVSFTLGHHLFMAVEKVFEFYRSQLLVAGFV
jgi:hypothetical protein